MRAPHAQANDITSSTIAGLPWQEISITSSPVYDWGHGKKVTTARSTVSLFLFNNLKRVALLGSKLDSPERSLRMFLDSGPLNRTVETPLYPSGVAWATIVSGWFISSFLKQLLVAPHQG